MNLTLKLLLSYHIDLRLSDSLFFRINATRNNYLIVIYKNGYSRG